MRKSVKIITDNTIDLIKGILVNELEIVDNYMFLNDSEVRFGREEFYKKIIDKKNLFKTSQANPEDFSRVFKKNEKSDLIVITTSSKLSGIYNSALIAKKNNPGIRVEVIDSKTTSIGVGMIVKKGFELLNTKADYESIVNELRLFSSRIRIFFVLKDLEYLVRSGRVNKALGFLGKTIGMKPVLQLIDGELKSAGRMIFSKNLAEEFYKFFKTKVVSAEKFFLVSNNLKRETNKLKSLLKNYDVEVVNYLTPVLGVYTGPECIGIGWVEK